MMTLRSSEVGFIISTSVLMIVGVIVAATDNVNSDLNHARLYAALCVYIVWNALWLGCVRWNPVPATVLTNPMIINDPRDGTCALGAPSCCLICLDGQSSRYVFRTQCGHEFCSHCMRQWLQTSHTCPTCRAPVQLHAMTCPACCDA